MHYSAVKNARNNVTVHLKMLATATRIEIQGSFVFAFVRLPIQQRSAKEAWYQICFFTARN